MIGPDRVALAGASPTTPSVQGPDGRGFGLACEGCGYDLRGHPPGEAIICPECGTSNHSSWAWQVVGPLECLRCRHDLRGQVGPRVTCPSCGSENDLRCAIDWAYRMLPLWVTRRLELLLLGGVISTFAFLGALLVAALWYVRASEVTTQLLTFFVAGAHWLWFHLLGAVAAHCADPARARSNTLVLYTAMWGGATSLLLGLAMSGNSAFPAPAWNAIVIALAAFLMLGIGVRRCIRAQREGVYHPDPADYRLPLGMYAEAGA